jgi:hypothetical protein
MMPLMTLDTAEYLYLINRQKYQVMISAQKPCLSVPIINLKTGLIDQSLHVEISFLGLLYSSSPCYSIIKSNCHFETT